MHKRGLRWVTSLGLLGLLGGAGCGSPRDDASRPGPVLHLVFVSLKDPGEADALVRDMDASLEPVPGLVRLSVGRPLTLASPPGGRPEVASDYHVGAVLQFASVGDYRRYEEHPAHRGILARWGPKVAALRIHDVEDRTP